SSSTPTLTASSSSASSDSSSSTASSDSRSTSSGCSDQDGPRQRVSSADLLGPRRRSSHIDRPVPISERMSRHTRHFDESTSRKHQHQHRHRRQRRQVTANGKGPNSVSPLPPSVPTILCNAGQQTDEASLLRVAGVLDLGNGHAAGTNVNSRLDDDEWELVECNESDCEECHSADSNGALVTGPLQSTRHSSSTTGPFSPSGLPLTCIGSNTSAAGSSSSGAGGGGSRIGLPDGGMTSSEAGGPSEMIRFSPDSQDPLSSSLRGYHIFDRIPPATGHSTIGEHGHLPSESALPSLRAYLPYQMSQLQSGLVRVPICGGNSSGGSASGLDTTAIRSADLSRQGLVVGGSQSTGPGSCGNVANSGGTRAQVPASGNGCQGQPVRFVQSAYPIVATTTVASPSLMSHAQPSSYPVHCSIPKPVAFGQIFSGHPPTSSLATTSPISSLQATGLAVNVFGFKADSNGNSSPVVTATGSDATSFLQTDGFGLVQRQHSYGSSSSGRGEAVGDTVGLLGHFRGQRKDSLSYKFLFYSRAFLFLPRVSSSGGGHSNSSSCSNSSIAPFPHAGQALLSPTGPPHLMPGPIPSVGLEVTANSGFIPHGFDGTALLSPTGPPHLMPGPIPSVGLEVTANSGFVPHGFDGTASTGFR
ncbi:unnamed protein product, partial [Protopolystoma xenopodis]